MVLRVMAREFAGTAFANERNRRPPDAAACVQRNVALLVAYVAVLHRWGADVCSE